MFDHTYRKSMPERLPYEPIAGDWYNAEYFEQTQKSNWSAPYRWESFSHIFEMWARTIVWAFPEAEWFLDVGCARGLLERGWHQLKELNKFTFQYHGFDVSEYAIATADPLAKPFIEVASVDTFKFTQKYDVIVCLDVFEHLTEAQARDFLRRSREHINDACFFVIALDEEHQRAEPSHINLRTREWWHKLFWDCGWRHNNGTDEMQRLALEDPGIISARCQPFIYSSR